MQNKPIDEITRDPEQYKHSAIHMDSTYPRLSKSRLRVCKTMKYHDHTLQQYVFDNISRFFDFSKDYKLSLRSDSDIYKLLQKYPVIFTWNYYDRQFHAYISDDEKAYCDIDESLKEYMIFLAENQYEFIDDILVKCPFDDFPDRITRIADAVPVIPIIILEKKQVNEGILVNHPRESSIYIKPSLGVNILHSTTMMERLKDFFGMGGVIKPYVWYYIYRYDTQIGEHYTIKRDTIKSPKMRLENKNETTEDRGEASEE